MFVYYLPCNRKFFYIYIYIKREWERERETLDLPPKDNKINLAFKALQGLKCEGYA